MALQLPGQASNSVSALSTLSDHNGAAGEAARWHNPVSGRRSFLVIAAVVVALELGVMFVLTLFPGFGELAEVLAFSAALTVISGVALYVALIHPMSRALNRYSLALRQRTQLAEETLADLSAYQHALDSHAIIAVTDASGKIIHANDAFCRLSKYGRDELLGQDHRIINSGTHPKAFWVGMWRTIAAGKVWQEEVCNRAKDGTLYWVDSTVVPILDAAGKPVKFISIRTDITSRKMLEDELRAAARTDKLTGLANRAALSDHLQHAILRARRNSNYKFAVLCLDFDRFKNVNDSLGHKAGDQLLCEIAKRLRAVLRENDAIARVPVELAPAADTPATHAVRLGGDEFVILLDDISCTNDARTIADRMLETLAAPYNIADTEVFCTASIGIFTSDSPCSSADDALRDADTAMYEAKLAGKGRYAVFDLSMRHRVESRLNIENELRRAIEAGQLSLFYQPIISLETGAMVTCEALLRWTHPKFGAVSPAEFIPISEDTGLIIPIGEWVLNEACRQLAEWRADPEQPAVASVCVNLSRNQLALPGLPALIRRVLATHKLDASMLHLEITESTVMRNPQTTLQTLSELKEIGVKLALDDFGTGYSSLSCLHQFPLDLLKIDRSFIANISRGREFTALVHAIILLARNLGIGVVAEGVESAEQVALLQSLDCQFVQGYFVSRPLSAEAFSRFKPNISLAPVDDVFPVLL
jgi:PAS domain S-box-containing protein